MKLTNRIAVGVIATCLLFLATTGNDDPTDNARVPSTSTTEDSCR